MKKVYTRFKRILLLHYKMSVFFATVLVLVSSISAVFSTFPIFVVPCFSFSLATLLRLITYKTGKIPIFMMDKTWDEYKFKYSTDEIEKKYEEMSINRATLYFMLAIPSFIIWGIVELLI